MCTDQIISFLTGIGTLAASLIALCTLLEIKRQRKESNKPEPAIKSTLISVYGMEFKDYYFPFNFSQSNDSDSETVNDIMDFRLDLVNVGIRSAKNIKVLWEFDFKKAIDFIETLNQDGLFKINLSDKRLEILFPKADYKEFNMIKNQLGEKQFDFLLNSTPESFDTIYLNIPIAVLKLYVIKLCLLLGYYKSDKSTQPKKVQFGEFPKLILRINYEDIAGVPYKKTFNFDIDLFSFTDPMTTRLEHKVGKLIIKANELHN